MDDKLLQDEGYLQYFVSLPDPLDKKAFNN